MTAEPLSLVSIATGAVTYRFVSAGPGFRTRAICTVNDATGELLITSDVGNWSYRWDPRPSSLGHATLTAFVGERGSVDYLARKLQGERGGWRFSVRKTVAAFRRILCARRLELGREDSERGRSPRCRGLARARARRIWDELGDLVNDCGDSEDLFLRGLRDVDGFTQHVDDTPFAPSWSILAPVLRLRKSDWTAGTEALWAVMWPRYVEQYTAEMRRSWRDKRWAWSRLLARSEVTLVCYCTDAVHCHRTVLASLLEKLGASVVGERA